MDSPQIIVVGSFVQDLTFLCTGISPTGGNRHRAIRNRAGWQGVEPGRRRRAGRGNVAFIGAVGRDAFGESARAFQEVEGIRWLVAEKPDRPTGAAGILVNSHGQNEIIVSLDANNALTAADVEKHAEALRVAAVVVTQLEANLEAEARALQIAREGGAMVILNPAPMRPDFDPALLENVDILIPNETEFVALMRECRKRRRRWETGSTSADSKR